MSFRKMQVFRRLDKSLLGYLGCVPSEEQKAVVTDYDHAYNYEWVRYDNGLYRLDKETSGGNRSLTYDSKLAKLACWGLGTNWLYLKLGADQSVIFAEGKLVYTLRYCLATPPALQWVSTVYEATGEPYPDDNDTWQTVTLALVP